jgi:SAM-dependent methyltransferase
MIATLTTQEYWEHAYGDTQFVEYPVENAHFDVLFSCVDRNRIKSAIEIGSYPGPFLAALGRCSYELNGIDFHPNNATGVPRWLKSLGFKTGEFVSQDFLDYKMQRKFDLVYSIGFIEHFLNFKEVILRHADLVTKGGYLFLSTPNFSGFIQKKFHQIFDQKNLEVHNLDAMNPSSWADVLEQNGFKVLYAGFYGGPIFWVDPASERSWFVAAASKLTARIFWNLRRIYNKESKHFSAFCGLVAVKS